MLQQAYWTFLGLSQLVAAAECRRKRGFTKKGKNMIYQQKDVSNQVGRAFNRSVQSQAPPEGDMISVDNHDHRHNPKPNQIKNYIKNLSEL